MFVSYFGHQDDESLADVISFLKNHELIYEKCSAKNFYNRLTFSEFDSTFKEIRKQISNHSIRKSTDLLVVEPKTAGTAAFAARDGRIDVVRINPKVGLSIYNKRYAQRLVENDTLVEIDLSFYFKNYYSKEIRQLYRIVTSFGATPVKYVLTNSPRHPFQLRSYRGLQSLAQLFGIERHASANRHIREKLMVNRKKREGIIPTPGVELIGREE